MQHDFQFVQDYFLENDYVLLRPICLEDIDFLLEYACNEPELWRHTLVSAAGYENMLAYINHATRLRKRGQQYAFIVFDKVTQSYAGTTRFCEINKETQCVQLGYTWYGKRFRGTTLNKHCKLLLLDFAFDFLKMERVEFRVDVSNEGGIEALKRLGCTMEGRLRSCGPARDSGRRDCYVFSILKDEWLDELRNRLEAKLFSNLNPARVI